MLAALEHGAQQGLLTSSKAAARDCSLQAINNLAEHHRSSLQQWHIFAILVKSVWRLLAGAPSKALCWDLAELQRGALGRLCGCAAELGAQCVHKDGAQAVVSHPVGSSSSQSLALLPLCQCIIVIKEFPNLSSGSF